MSAYCFVLVPQPPDGELYRCAEDVARDGRCERHAAEYEAGMRWARLIAESVGGRCGR